MTDLSPNTQLAVLLTARWAVNGSKPLTNRELGEVRTWMQSNGISAEALLQGQVNLSDAPIEQERLQGLLNRGLGVFTSLDKWRQAGIWVLSWSDPEFPDKFKQLKSRAPMLLFGYGDPNAFTNPSLAIVGSRKASEARLEQTAKIAQQCAEKGVTVVSGGAKGVDAVAMEAAAMEGGHVVGVLSDSLLRQCAKKIYRQAISEDRMCLMSEVHPEARFEVGNAMARNRLAYACANAALVIECEPHKGGTWAGAQDALKEGKSVYVLKGAQAETELVERGAVAIEMNFALDVHALVEGKAPQHALHENMALTEILQDLLASEPTEEQLVERLTQDPTGLAQSIHAAAIKDGWIPDPSTAKSKTRSRKKKATQTASLFPEEIG